MDFDLHLPLTLTTDGVLRDPCAASSCVAAAGNVRIPRIRTVRRCDALSTERCIVPHPRRARFWEFSSVPVEVFQHLATFRKSCIYRCCPFREGPRCTEAHIWRHRRLFVSSDPWPTSEFRSPTQGFLPQDWSLPSETKKTTYVRS